MAKRLRILKRIAANVFMVEMIQRSTYIAYSEIGKRKKNEDAYFPVSGEESNNLFFVCDGIGGNGDGDLASAFVQLQLQQEITSAELTPKQLSEAILETNSKLMRYSQQVGNLQMGCTVAVLQVQNNQAIVGWVGDSRVYHFRKDEILFRTKDHTLFELLRESEDLGDEAEVDDRTRNVIYQALGPKNSRLKPSIQTLNQVEKGDIFLLCTDGLLEAWQEEDLQELIKQKGMQSAEEIRNKCALHSKDNYTFILVQVK